MSCVAITGASGFIGSALVDEFLAHGWRVAGCGRQRPAALPAEVEWRHYDLNEPEVSATLLDGADVLIHGALVAGDYDVNVAGGRRLLDEAQRRGVRMVFLSSLAAHEGALSSYGRQKWVLERLFAERGALVVRPGLVVGDGSIFRTTCEYLKTHRVVPLIGDGRQPLQTVFVGDLVAAVRWGVEMRMTGVYTVAETEPVGYGMFYRAVARQLGREPMFVPVPFPLALMAFRVAKRLGVRLPVDQDNLLGLRAMRPDNGARLEAPDRPVGRYAENISRALD
ncbi:MAG: NAD(P)-dependent oxidoreductase [Candidatus Eremiobacteraeota bacterium]|nr:NAD(P)-dependent oxidoreductase [Candidatus Eremiobacteraeota bacterium]